MQTIFPILRYIDARVAIRWLCDVLDFAPVLVVPDAGPVVRHAQLRLGSNVVMVGSVRPDDGLTSPAVCGVATQALCVFVPDVDAHHQRAIGAAPDATGPIETTDFGARQFTVRDVEGHSWILGNYRPEPLPISQAPGPSRT